MLSCCIAVISHTFVPLCPFNTVLIKALKRQWYKLADPRTIKNIHMYAPLVSIDNTARTFLLKSLCRPYKCSILCIIDATGSSNSVAINPHNIRLSSTSFSLQLAAWLDSSVSSVSSQLEQKAQHFTELSGETVTSLHVCELLSAVVTESGKIYWW